MQAAKRKWERWGNKCTRCLLVCLHSLMLASSDRCMLDMQLENASIKPNEPGIGSPNGQKLHHHVTYKLELILSLSCQEQQMVDQPS